MEPFNLMTQLKHEAKCRCLFLPMGHILTEASRIVQYVCGPLTLRQMGDCLIKLLYDPVQWMNNVDQFGHNDICEFTRHLVKSTYLI